MTFVVRFSFLSSRLFSSSSLFVRKKCLCISAGRSLMESNNEVKSPKKPLEITTVSPIVSLYRQALVTFNDKNKKDLATNLTKLKSMLNTLRAEDLNFDKSLYGPGAWKKQGKAPCTYVEVFQNNVINMSVFVLKPGFTMPLHDHPKMYGMLKVIAGAVHIRSFSEFPVKELMKKVDIKTKAKLEASRLAAGIYKRRRFYAEITAESRCTSNTEACILTPTASNYHEIKTIDGAAAFFDILAPPYDTVIEGEGPRRCRYYKVINEISTNLVELQETDVPECFYCDQAPYLGPILS